MRSAWLVLLATVGCSGSDEPPASTPKPAAQRDTLVIAVASDARDLLSVISQSAADASVIEATSALPMEADFDCRVTWQPSLATSWIFAEDGKGITISLRDDRVWSDGDPITAEDYAFTYALATDPTVGYPNAEALRRLDPLARPRVVDAKTVEFRFTEAYDRATMLSHVALPLVPKHLLDSPTVDRTKLREHPVNGTAPVSGGPFRVAEWERGERLVLVPNERFGGGKQDQPKLARVEYRVIPDYRDRITALSKGEVDLVESVLVEDADKLAADHPEIALHRRGWRSLDYVAWNNLDPADWKARAAGGRPDPATVRPHALFGDREVRRALTTAIDVEALIHQLLTSEATGDVYGRPAVSTITPALCAVHDDTIKRLPYDASAARARLAELGWTDSNADGVVDKDGVPLRFTLLTNEGNPRRLKAAGLIQAALREVGVEAQVEALAQEALLDRLRQRDYDAALTGLSAGLFVDPSSVWAADAEYNFVGYHSPAAQELLVRGLAEPDPDRARGVWREFQRVVYEDQPYTFLYWMDDLVALHNRFRSPTIDVLAPYRRLHQWSVPIDRVKYPAPAE